MWKYIDKEKSKEFLLSLGLLNDNISDKDKIIKLYSISNNVEKNYKIFKIKKRNGKYRTIYEPNYTLKEIQKNILNNILNNKKISIYAKAYHKGIGLIDNAKEHVNKKLILKLDIKDFFENISFIDVYNSCFEIEYFPKEIGILLTHLCTYKEHLPQGAPTSSYISNLVLKEFDEYIGVICKEENISYTRYSDDMTFSGDFNPSKIITIVKKELRKYNLELNNEKIHVIRNHKCQKVTGLVVNNKVQTPISYRKNIRKEIFYIKKYGLDSHLEHNSIKDRNKYLNELYGRILFVLQINNTNEFKEYKEFISKLKSHN